MTQIRPQGLEIVKNTDILYEYPMIQLLGDIKE